MKFIRRAMALTALTVVGLGATAPSAQAAAKDVTPIFECAAPNSDGTYTAFFGYDNGAGPTNIPVGTMNQFTTPPKDRGQPTSFESGRHVAVFAVRFDAADSPKWHVGNTTATASTAKLCSAPAELSEASSWLALPVASLGSIGLWFVIQRRRTGMTPPTAPAVA